jgi:PAS domain S-box-containing protein
MDWQMRSFPRLKQSILGPLFTVAVVLIIALAERYFWVIPNPPAILLLALVFSAYAGGTLSGIASATITWLYIVVFFSIAGRPFHYTDENLRRVAVWAITLPATALLVGSLKNRSLQQLAEIKESEIRLRSVLENIADAVFTFDKRGAIESWNPAAERLFGYPAAEAIGQDISALLAAEGLSAMPLSGHEVLCRSRDGADLSVEIAVTEMPFRNNEVRFIGTARDLRERKRAEEEQRRAQEERSQLQEELIRAQASALVELSTPLIPVRSQILVMPLVGAMDARRAARVLEVLLKGISDRRAHSAIIDVTGVSKVDAEVTGALLRAASAARMLGAQVVLTGIRPEVAQGLVAIGADLRGVVTCRTLEQGIAFAEAQTDRR